MREQDPVPLMVQSSVLTQRRRSARHFAFPDDWLGHAESCCSCARAESGFVGFRFALEH